jgi:hypothetical protein
MKGISPLSSLSLSLRSTLTSKINMKRPLSTLSKEKRNRERGRGGRRERKRRKREDRGEREKVEY